MKVIDPYTANADPESLFLASIVRDPYYSSNALALVDWHGSALSATAKYICNYINA
jgi:hypothetical protein